jgi:hypothetical protein
MAFLACFTPTMGHIGKKITAIESGTLGRMLEL